MYKVLSAVDALCIIQGPDGDWLNEIPRMESVYAGSILAIAVADAENSNEGFLGSRSPLCYQSRRLNSDDSTTLLAEHWLKWCEFSPNVPGSTALDLRDRGTICENKPPFETQSDNTNGHSSYDNLKMVYLEFQEAPLASLYTLGDRHPVLMLWNRVVSVHFKTSLSRQEEKLTTLAGIARCSQPRLKMKTSFGVSASNA